MAMKKNKNGYAEIVNEPIGNFDFVSSVGETPNKISHQLTEKMISTTISEIDEDGIQFVYKGSPVRIYLEPNELYCSSEELALECIQEIRDRYEYITSFKVPKSWK